MVAKLNVWGIVTGHLDTFRPYKTARDGDSKRKFDYNLGEIAFHYVLPFIVAALLVLWRGFTVNDGIADILLTSLSILAALLFNLLMMVFDTLRRFQEANRPRINELTDLELVRWDLLKQTYINISYSIFVSLVAVLILVCVAIWDSNSNAAWITELKKFVSFAVYFLVFNFSLTLFIVLKRIHILFSSEINSFKPASK